jgi:hypothetical protein
MSIESLRWADPNSEDNSELEQARRTNTLRLKKRKKFIRQPPVKSPAELLGSWKRDKVEIEESAP